MNQLRAVLLSLPVVAVLIGALTLGLVLLGRYWNLGVVTLFLLVVPIALAVAYLWWYSKLPYEPLRPTAAPSRTPAPPPMVDEPFEDPVEEADRYARTGAPEPPPEEPAIVEDDSPSDPVPPP
jgi:hypothetical protein